MLTADLLFVDNHGILARFVAARVSFTLHRVVVRWCYASHEVVRAFGLRRNLLCPRNPPYHAPPPHRSSTALSAIRVATFGMGCFWEPAESLLKVDGVIDTVAGYTRNPVFDSLNDDGNNNNAGTMKVPPYESVCASSQWVEAVRVQYDDAVLSYPQLLEQVFEFQKPQPGSRQYASILFPPNDEQAREAKALLDANIISDRTRQDGWKAEWTHNIENASRFYQAEGYHQNDWQKNRPRLAAILLLLAVASGLGNGVIPIDKQEMVQNVANGVTVALGLTITLEPLSRLQSR